LVAQARAAGALIRVQGNRVILSPPLVFTKAHVDQAMSALHHAFAAAEAL
jgi:adenosylmethionine-8-amino-7-oxononanoate aminotransferase